MDIKEIIRHTVIRLIHKAGNQHGDMLKIDLAAVEIIADEIAGELVELFSVYKGGEE